MDKSKLLKLFIILFKHEMFNSLKESIIKFVEFIIACLYAALLFTIYPLRPIQFFFRAIKYRKEWATEEKYNKYFGSNR